MSKPFTLSAAVERMKNAKRLPDVPPEKVAQRDPLPTLTLTHAVIAPRSHEPIFRSVRIQPESYA